MPAKKPSAPKKPAAAKKAAGSKAVPAVTPAPNPRVSVRTYRHGLGDCHLLRFARRDGAPFHMLIDCGIVELPKDAAGQTARMTHVAQNIQSVTAELDVVVATHQHTDHLSGFRQARSIFDKIAIKRLWMAWTEDKSDPLGRQIQRQLVKKLATVRASVQRLAAFRSAGARQAAEHIQSVLDFFGPAALGDKTQAILDYLETRVEKPDYFEPGMVFPLHEEVPNVRVYVLGPPKDAAAMKITNPRKKAKEGYEFALAASADGLDAALSGEAERAQPFDLRHRIPEEKAARHPDHGQFFKTRYLAGDSTRVSDPQWRKIDSSWLELAEHLALALEDYTNNTSLALAFEFIDTGEVMLFPGDAQIGSWLTWGRLEWEVKDTDGTKRKVRLADLFARTVFYKAAHHASHNGTLSGYGVDHIGLEHMTHRDLVCVVPVDVKMSREKHWDRTLPWEPLLRRLREKTRGRLILTDTAETPPDPAALLDLSEAERKRFGTQVTYGNASIPGTSPPAKIGWVEYIL